MKTGLSVAVLCACLTLGGLVVACGDSGSGGQGGGASSGSPATAGKKRTLTFFDWTSLGNPAGQRLVQAYEKLHPDVDVQITKLPPSSSTTSFVQTLLAGGTASDVMT